MAYLLSIEKDNKIGVLYLSTGGTTLAKVRYALDLDIKCLLIDEPFANTDNENTNRVKDALHRFSQSGSIITTCTGSHRDSRCALF